MQAAGQDVGPEEQNTTLHKALKRGTNICVYPAPRYLFSVNLVHHPTAVENLIVWNATEYYSVYFCI